jgi:hypothetical protein
MIWHAVLDRARLRARKDFDTVTLVLALPGGGLIAADSDPISP